ncbi:MAG: TIGR00366 family protein, partial [Phycisphaerales bacterium]
AITLNTVNLTLLSLGFWLHQTPARLARAFARATPATWGLLLQFPLYGGIAALITDSKLSERVAEDPSTEALWRERGCEAEVLTAAVEPGVQELAVRVRRRPSPS